jgi:hypothetical protein
LLSRRSSRTRCGPPPRRDRPEPGPRHSDLPDAFPVITGSASAWPAIWRRKVSPRSHRAGSTESALGYMRATCGAPRPCAARESNTSTPLAAKREGWCTMRPESVPPVSAPIMRMGGDPCQRSRRNPRRRPPRRP